MGFPYAYDVMWVLSTFLGVKHREFTLACQPKFSRLIFWQKEVRLKYGSLPKQLQNYQRDRYKLQLQMEMNTNVSIGLKIAIIQLVTDIGPAEIVPVINKTDLLNEFFK